MLTFRSWHFGCSPESVLISENAMWCSTRSFMARACEWLCHWGPFEKEHHEQAKSPVSWAACPTALQVFAEQGETSELTLWYCHCEATGTWRVHLLSTTRKHFHHVTGDVIVCVGCFFKILYQVRDNFLSCFISHRGVGWELAFRVSTEVRVRFAILGIFHSVDLHTG